MIHLFHEASQTCSQDITRTYSTSFASAIRLLHKDLRAPICNIYGFVRLADEIVDTFHEFDKQRLLSEFKVETFAAIARGISLNPVLHSFQLTVNQYEIDHDLINAFFHSMEMDLDRKVYDEKGYEDYIYGSAEVVGLMCLQVFCEGKKEAFEKLKTPARALGAAFQKVNFLRDIQADYNGLARVYFPCCDFNNFTAEDKRRIEEDIHQDFKAAYRGITHLPLKARFGVYVAYKYYLSLFRKIRKMQPSTILHQRVRIPDYHKVLIILRAGLKNKLRLIAPQTGSISEMESSF
ncbi:phytoene/squalene synthase family protein [Terrimonas sp. NA20]|uniref:Phytoene/squalene synthase family protein n=1 Tax=Terrimonas ginsenosidimutans TaxID=2908004 RepID=A0ABS9KNW7_9BACT|nr:phytoene/squalene synthase family protein [Terrimonas ginsenosidimutans]MCG2613996.1 phytoene/squalene synthase family protein [Terrimonas ginsenosidimutans]